MTDTGYKHLRNLLLSAVTLSLLAFAFSGCGSIANSIRKVAAKDSVLKDEMPDYRYETPAPEVWSETKDFFRNKDFDLKEDRDVSYHFKTDWDRTDYPDKMTRKQYIVDGTETDSGFKVEVTVIRETKSEGDTQWSTSSIEGGRGRDYPTELELVKHIEPERGKEIQAKIDKAQKRAVSEEG